MFLADFYGVEFDILARQTTQNFLDFFNLKLADHNLNSTNE